MTRRLFIAGLAGTVISGALLSGSFGSLALAQDTSARDLARITNYLNGITTLEGNFIQVGPDGELSEGLFYLRRPGRLRFEYEPPNPALIIADGTWVGVYDKRLNTLDRIPIGSTPLDILLSKRVDLREEGAVQSIENQGGLMRVRAIDPDAPDQGSITMVFADNPLELRQWIVVDPQGLTTTVALSDIRSNVKLDAKLFFIEDPNR
jgi:outer membrane lipoprotein-sorting protein